MTTKAKVNVMICTPFAGLSDMDVTLERVME